MAGEIEAMGAFTTAGLAASTLDGPSPARRGAAARPIRGASDLHADPHDIAHGACANCATPLTGNFCHACGQSAHVHRSVGHIFEEFLHGIWHFDSKAWRTIPRLAFMPGRLTREYVYGKRAGYIAPLALFLFSIFLMFFVFGFVGGPDLNGLANAAGTRDDIVNEAQSTVKDAQAEVTAAVTELAEAKADPDTTPAERATLEKALAERRAEVDAASAALAKAEKAPVVVDAKDAKRTWQERLSEAARSGQINVNTGFPAVNKNILKALQNPDFALYKVEQKAYKLSFLLVPLSLPVLWLMFVFRRDVHTYDHVVFALYSLSFMSLLFVVAVVLVKASAALQALGGPAIGSLGLLMLVPPVHMFFQLKGAYRLSTGGALWRTVFLSFGTTIILSLFIALIVVVGLAD